LPLDEYDWLKWSHDKFRTHDVLTVVDSDVCNDRVQHV